MSAFVVLPDVTRTEPVATTAGTVVMCGSPEHLRDAYARGALSGATVTALPSAAQVRLYADRHAAPDVCVIVTPLPDGPAVPLIRMLRARGWQRVVVLSSKADARAIHATLVAGVRSVIVRKEPDSPVAPLPLPGAATLSERELEVLRMVADGQTNRAVGERLGVSALTVKSHLARIARKLGSGDRAEMVATAIRCGYIA
jgi:DNA-binding NarL/FixJ family response regulator